MSWSPRRRSAPPTTPGRQDTAPVATDAVSVALETLVTRFARLLHHVALRHGLASEDVAEVVQEVRVRVWRARPESETIASLGTSYIYRTAMSAALEVVRRKRGSGPVTTLADTQDERSEVVPAGAVESDARGPEQSLVRSELAHALSQALLELPDRRRTAVRLHLVGYSRDEIARMTGWSEAVARNLIYRGLAELRAGLERRGIGAGEIA
jgi:RNA polymerase sigma factor (sigma-70 family)